MEWCFFYLGFYERRTTGGTWNGGTDCLWLENGDAVPDGISGVFGVGIGIDGHVNVPYTEKTLTVKGAPRPKGATAADMATAEYINGLGWVISDMSGKGFGWIDGKINGIGTHEELLAKNEIYREVYESQTGGSGDFDEKGGDQ